MKKNAHELSISDVEEWLVVKIAEANKKTPEDNDKNLSLYGFGFDSLHIQSMIADIEDTFSIKIDVEFSLAQENIHDLSELIHMQIKEQNAHPNMNRVHHEHISNERNINVIKNIDATDFKSYPPYQNLIKLKKMLGDNIFFDKQEGVSRDTCIIDGSEYLNFTSYNYLGLSSHPVVVNASIEAIKKYGTSVSASRLVSGEKTIHSALENEVASLLGVDSSLIFTAGHATNVSTISHLYGADDLILHDELAHNSIVLGAVYSGATRVVFPHNNWQAADEILKRDRHLYKRVVIIIEGIYSMDGDIADLVNFIDVKNRHQAWLMVDEAHSIGVLGKGGGGIREHFNVAPNSVELWMGTLSKSFASCGGYIAGRRELIEYLKFTCPGFVFSAGMPPSNVGAALAAIQVLKSEPSRVETLRQLSTYARDIALSQGFNIGLNDHTPILPIIIGDSKKCIELSKKCMEKGVNIKPIIYPAVPEDGARMRMFISTLHKESQIKKAFDVLSSVWG